MAGLDDASANRGGASRRRSTRGGATGARPRRGARARVRESVATRAAADRAEHRRLVREAGAAVGHEPRRCRAEHEARHEGRGGGARAAARSDRPSSSRRRSRGRYRARERGRAVVGAVGEAEHAPGADALAVTAQVGGDHAESLAERSKAWNQFRPPVATHPCSSEQRGRALRARHLTDERGAPPRELERADRARISGPGRRPWPVPIAAPSTVSGLLGPIGRSSWSRRIRTPLHKNADTDVSSAGRARTTSSRTRNSRPCRGLRARSGPRTSGWVVQHLADFVEHRGALGVREHGDVAHRRDPLDHAPRA